MIMQTKEAVAALAALAHETRLSVFRLLVAVGPQGMPATRISDQLQVAPSSLSFHLKELLHADLVTARQEGRFIYYAATYSRLNDLMAFLTDNCCGGTPCTPVCKTNCSEHDVITNG
jgi:ArsR family transcriptional regulator, arsenate/arsenite/antimonite-responsive transcriptional repressor